MNDGWTDEAYLARGPAQVSVPLLAEALHGSGVPAPAQWCVMEERVKWGAETVAVHLPPSLSASIILSTVYGEELQMKRLYLSLRFPLVLYLCSAHEPRVELPSPNLHLAVDRSQNCREQSSL